MLIRKIPKAILFIVLFLLVSCNTFKPEYELLVSEKEEYYAINPDTILNSIAQGDIKDIFIPLSTEPLDDKEQAVHWIADDYLRVVRVFSEQVNNETLDHWYIKRVLFDYGCADIGKGFERGRLQFFKVGDFNGKGVRTVMDIDLMPMRKIIYRAEEIYSPVVEKWEAIDLKAIKISAEEAVEIAERMGGSDARAKVADSCFVNIDLLPKGVVGYNGWTVSYRIFSERSSIETIFEILINPQNGNFQVVISQ